MAHDVTTIAALATAPAPAGLAVVRMSGPNTRQAIKALFRGAHSPVDEARLLCFGDLIDHKTGDVIDRAMAVFMPGPASYTGEDVGEFQFHGSPILVQKVLRSLFAFGITPAEPGEFTKRAFLSGKIDLVQAEAIADLINATGEEALKVASEQLRGRFSRTIQDIAEPLRNTLAEIEANIDFPDEGIEPERLSSLALVISETQRKLEGLIDTYSFGHVLKEGYKVLLCGPPNAGKSSLLNRMLGKDRAIVTDIPGTTRDLIEENLTLGGRRFLICDSAGIADTTDKVEQIGIELARSRVAWADLVVFVVDAASPPKDWEMTLNSLRSAAKQIWLVVNKIDTNSAAIGTLMCDSKICAQNLYVSAKTGAGLELLTQALIDEVESSRPDSADTSQIVTNERQRNCLTRAIEALSRSSQGITSLLPPEIISAEIRISLTALSEIVGTTYTEDILGRIFGKFCIGK